MNVLLNCAGDRGSSVTAMYARAREARGTELSYRNRLLTGSDNAAGDKSGSALPGCSFV